MLVLFLSALFAVAGDDGTLTLTGAADLHGWSESGAVRLSLPAIRTGAPADLFDGDARTMMRCGREGSAEFDFTFAQPVSFYQLLIHTGGAGVYRWRAEASRTPGDRKQGDRMKPCIDWQYIKANELKPVSVAHVKEMMKLKIVIERLSLGREIDLCEIGCYTQLEIRRLLLENCPDNPRVGTPFHPVPLAVDRFGGRLRLDEGVVFTLTPPAMATWNEGACTPQHAGKAGLSFSFGSLTSVQKTLTISAPDPPPDALDIVPFSRSLAINIRGGSDACDAWAVCCRNDGDPTEPEPKRVTQNRVLTLYGLEPDSVYHLSAAGLDARGNRITPFIEETRVRTLPENSEGLMRIATIDVLFPIYTEGLAQESIAQLIKGFEQARTFIFRSSRARLHIDPQYILLSDGTPTIRVPGMHSFERDLRQRGLLDRAFGALHLVAEGLTENLSGYIFHNDAVGSMGMTASALWPEQCTPQTRTACWTWVHEFQHSFEWIVRSQGDAGARLLHGHFLENYPLKEGQCFDAGDNYDGQRELFRRFDGYDALPSTHFRYMEVVDTDHDGMPDDDARLPMDEKRFHSLPEKKDSDDDGLGDLDEFCAGIYEGTLPGSIDTDADGLNDGEDPYPLSDFTGLIPFGTPLRGEAPKGLLSRSQYFTLVDDSEDLIVHASWDHDFLYLHFEAETAMSITLSIDGSGHLGRFESDRVIHSNAKNGKTDKPGSDVYANDRALHVSFGSPHLMCGEERVSDTKVLSAERDGKRLIWIAVPARLGAGTTDCFMKEDAEDASGLTLEEGRILGFNILIRPQNKHANSASQQWGSLYEPYRYYDAVLLLENE